MSFRSMEMLPKDNRAESDLNSYTVFGEAALCLVPSNVPGKLYPAYIFTIVMLVCLLLYFLS